MTRPAHIHGIAASMGVAVGPARLVFRGPREGAHAHVMDEAVEDEVLRFRRAVQVSREEIERAKDELTKTHGSAYAPILDVYLLMHSDALLIDATADAIAEQRINAEWALHRVVERLKAPLLKNESAYFRERAQDIDHVQEHLLRHLAGECRDEPRPTEPCVLIAHDLTPADAVHLLAPPTVGLVTEMGGASSHTAILARTFGVPTVAGTGPLPVTVRPGETIVVDGFSGEVTIGPAPDEQASAERRRTRFLEFLSSERTSRAVTLDGTPISLGANIELASEVDAAMANGAEGIGLYRTEFMCLGQSKPPGEDEQVALYLRVCSSVSPNRAVFRTFDWRDDKRLSVNRPGGQEAAWFRTQIRALHRANTHGTASIMFPMVATIEQFQTARAVVDACSSESSGAESDLPVGMMVEVPSAALMADEFAKHADFFAVGTNDLTQYTLGFDRRDYRAASEASPLHPAVLSLIAKTLEAAGAAGIPCSMCGDMCVDPIGLALALGLGFRTLSVPVSAMPLARAVVRAVDLTVASDTARRALECSSVEAVRTLALAEFGPELNTLWLEGD